MQFHTDHGLVLGLLLGRVTAYQFDFFQVVVADIFGHILTVKTGTIEFLDIGIALLHRSNQIIQVLVDHPVGTDQLVICGSQGRGPACMVIMAMGKNQVFQRYLRREASVYILSQGMVPAAGPGIYQRCPVTKTHQIDSGITTAPTQGLPVPAAVKAKA